MAIIVLRKIPFFLPTLLLTIVVCNGQSEIPALNLLELKGKVKTATLVREYLIFAGRAVQPRQIVLYQEEFNVEGKEIRRSDYGNIERRTTYAYQKDERVAQTLYYDLNGRVLSLDKPAFISKADMPLENDLCPTYTTRTHSDTQARIRRSVERCSSGSPRATVVDEENAEGTYYRTVREDSKGRSWESVAIFNSSDQPLEFRYIVNTLTAPKYSWNLSYVNHKSDATGNLIETIASAVHSSRPNQVWYQYFERFEIIYF